MEIKQTEKAVLLISIIDILADLLCGSEFESQADFMEFRQFVIQAGYNPELLDGTNLIKTFQIFCKEFADLDLALLK